MRNFALALVLVVLAMAGCSTERPLAEANPQLYQSLAARVGKTYYLRQSTSLYAPVDGKVVLGIQPGDAPFKIVKVVTLQGVPTYEVEFGNGRAYLYASPFDESVYSTEDPAIAREREKRAEAEKRRAFEELTAKKRAEEEVADALTVEQFLAGMGIKPGTSLWLKLPYENLSGLTRITFSRVQMRNGQVFLIGEIERGREASVLVAYGIPRSAGALEIDVSYRFFRKDPSRGWGKRIVEGIKRRAPVIGMTSEQLRAAMGAPKKVNETVGVWGTEEQWVYSLDDYVYLRNGRLYAMQR